MTPIQEREHAGRLLRASMQVHEFAQKIQRFGRLRLIPGHSFGDALQNVTSEAIIKAGKVVDQGAYSLKQRGSQQFRRAEWSRSVPGSKPH